MVHEQTHVSLPKSYGALFDHMRETIPDFAGTNNPQITQQALRELAQKNGVDLCKFFKEKR
jgi:hypothetical protein